MAAHVAGERTFSLSKQAFVPLESFSPETKETMKKVALIAFACFVGIYVIPVAIKLTLTVLCIVGFVTLFNQIQDKNRKNATGMNWWFQKVVTVFEEGTNIVKKMWN